MFEGKEVARSSRAQIDLFQNVSSLKFASYHTVKLDFAYTCIWKNMFKS